MSRVAILGGGLTGISTALALAANGIASTLIEQDPLLCNRASLRNEGKIHLGLIYANEGSLDTARRQLEGALSFERLLRGWIGERFDEVRQSTPFTYLVPSASLLSAAALERHYLAVEDLHRQVRDTEPSWSYLGTRLGRLYRRLEAVEAPFRPSYFTAAFATAERALDTADLARVLRRAVAGNSAITTVTGTRVNGVRPVTAGYRVTGRSAAGDWSGDFSQVVNCLWEGRVAIDQTMGLAPPANLLYRLKYRVIVELPETLRGGPSATLVLGKFGDVVIRRDGTAYLSWYPAGMLGWSGAVVPPSEWDAPCLGAPDVTLSRQLVRDTLREIDDWYPGIGKSQVMLVDAGVICARGVSDIDDRHSELHGRSQAETVSVGGYHSVDPGKLTTAPLTGQQAALRVLQC